jgi:hypothetical protein
MCLLALLGDEQLRDELLLEEGGDVAESKLSVLATRSTADNRPASFSVLLVNADHNSTERMVVKLALGNLLASVGHDQDAAAPDAKYAVYKVSNADTNPREVWERQGEPQFPTPKQMSEMRKAGALKRSPVKDLDRTHFNVKLPAPSVKLLHVCFKQEVRKRCTLYDRTKMYK